MPDSSADPFLPPQPRLEPFAAAAVDAARPDPDMPPRKAKLKRPLTEKLRAAAEQRQAHLRARLRLQPLPAPPLAPAEGSPEEAALRALGLLDFARLGPSLSSEPLRPDLVAPLVAYHDPAQRRSFVRGVRVGVSRKHFADALCLPCKPAPTAPQPEADPAAVVAASQELLQAYVLPLFQGDDMCILPQEVVAAEQAVKDGSAHRVDWAGLIWGLVEKEMHDLPKRDDGLCYYGAYLQRLIRAHKPELFEQTEEERGEAVLEVSDMEEEEADDDADAKSKSMEELESGDADADERSNCLDKLEIGGADLGSNSLEELESGDANVRGENAEELELAVEDELNKGLDDTDAANVDANHMDLDESEATDEDAKGKSFGESEMGFVSVGAVSVTHEVMLPNDEDAAEAAAEEDGDTAMATVDKDAGSLTETLVMTHEEFVAVPEDDDEEADGDEEKDATGLSLGIGSVNDYDSTDMEEDANVENLCEGDSANEEAEESEEDAFGQYRSEEMNWTMGDEKGHGSDFVNLQFENLNKGDVEIRNEVSYDDEFSGKMGSLHGMTSTNLLQAMSSIPATYNVSENAPDLSSGEFLAMGADAHKNGLDLGTGSSYFFENNGKRHIGEIEEYNDHMPGNEQFDQRNQHKRLRNSNNSSISPGSAVFNAHFAEPFQNLMSKASMFYEQKERELQDVLVEKQYLANLLQEKEQIIQSLNSARFEQENKWQAEIRRFEHDLNVMAQLVTGYRRALKQNRASFDEYRKKFPCDKPRYCDVPGGGGLVLSVKELEKKRLEEEQQKLAMANEMIGNFQHEWFSKFDGWARSIHYLRSRTEELVGELTLLREKRKAKVTTPVMEEANDTAPATEEANVITAATEDMNAATEEVSVITPATEEVNVITSATEEREVTTAATEEANITTPAIEEAKVTTPATEEAKVTTPATEEANVTTPATEEANVTTLATEEANITTTATEETNITTSATEEAQVTIQPTEE
ncbi:uncharacterized protein LOC102704430 [Oryza brachyantha]|uniref:uncharacterized protein LOC102704430 n=1 Tax=Oryza brachyantha TaxID=4533 RepID=UPI001AD9FAA9|nr:uncharacterized protein LOC102704430 [Oryza brachyantha]